MTAECDAGPRPIDPDLLSDEKWALSLSASDIERAPHPAKRKVRLRQNGSESRSRSGFNSRTPQYASRAGDACGYHGIEGTTRRVICFAKGHSRGDVTQPHFA
jgi:hypothetical protein